MPTIAQIRAARALLDWSQADLADKAGLSQTGIARIENGTNRPNTSTLEKISTAFDTNDIEFIGETGVKKRTGEIKTLTGKTGFLTFMDEIYETAKAKGGTICLHNAQPENWYKWAGEETYKAHAERMREINNEYKFLITTHDKATNLISSDFAEYRHIPDDIFNDQSIYSYGNKLAFIEFLEGDVVIRIIENEKFAEGFKGLFLVMWENVAKKI